MSCIATWKQDNYIFSVLSDMNHAAPWCLRIQEPVDDLREAHIFLDTICDPGDSNGMFSTIDMLILDLNKITIPSMCADEFEGCSDERFCQTNYRPFCHRTCGICKDDVDLCTFPESMNGNWLIGNNEGKSDVMRVETYKIDVPGSGSFHCLAKNVSKNNRVMLLHVFKNGCYPRFACLEQRKYSKSTLLFRIGKRLNWPDFPFENTKDKTCRDDKFKILADTGTGSEYVDLPMTPAMDASEFSTMDCKLPDDFGFRTGFLYFRDNSSKCDVCFSYMPTNRNDLFDVTSVNYTDNCPKYPYSFYCGASFNFSDIETHAVITGTIEDRRQVPNFLCWAFVGKGDKRKLIVLNSSGCNKLTIQRVINGAEKPLAIFQIREKERNMCTLSWPIPSNPIRPTTRLPPIRTDEPTYRPINDAGRLNNIAPLNMAPSTVSLRTLGFAVIVSYFMTSLSQQR
ncbi:hypothetical protein FSP39_010718 [Pinctada imbricata]|uniref:Uncharacterized protein n=1 Tax=Pinctada imbricata TaxID=66713 RepID=A0AA88XN88_PINIB|nr:hypothetical protein FSP39_010718 [Pinctada imbricata]